MGGGAAGREIEPADLLGRQPLFEGLGREETAEILKTMTAERRGKGEVLFREGDRGEVLYVLCSGSVEVKKGGRSLAVLEAPTVVGEMALLSGGGRSATLLARTDLSILGLSRKEFAALIARGSLAAYKVGLNIARVLAQRLTRVDEEMIRALARGEEPGEFESFRKKLLKDWSF